MGEAKNALLKRLYAIKAGELAGAKFGMETWDCRLPDPYPDNPNYVHAPDLSVPPTCDTVLCMGGHLCSLFPEDCTDSWLMGRAALRIWRKYEGEDSRRPDFYGTRTGRQLSELTVDDAIWHIEHGCQGWPPAAEEA